MLAPSIELVIKQTGGLLLAGAGLVITLPIHLLWSDRSRTAKHVP
jgi:hypothetical protein